MALGLSAFTACSSGGGGGGGGGGIALQLETVTNTLTFPTFLTAAPGDSTRLFICEKGGRIVIFSGGIVQPVAFLDLTGFVSTGEEQGLLSMAFDPDYANTGRFYVSYTDPLGGNVIARYTVDALDPNLADVASAEPLLTIDQKDEFHNGGMIAFGPDGFLWIGKGDGNGDIGGDPFGNAQDLSDLLGGLLRIDVSPVTGYDVPLDNPYLLVGGALPENHAIGLRNPWRFSFDRTSGDLYIADVGQDDEEEIDVTTAAAASGANFGWNIAEGDNCFTPPVGCSTVGQVLPVHTYPHTGGRCSVTGGYVYRGAAIPALAGTYFFGDFCTGGVSSFVHVGGAATELTNWPTLDPSSNITSFGEDADGELYILTAGGGVFRIVPN
ncbi:MAG: PQQ-dependent sugar dehydrogenase [Planctomycetota bacterium]